MLYYYIVADILYLLATVLLLLRIYTRGCCADISAKCQLLQAISYTVKTIYTLSSESYGFLFYHFASKLFFIIFTYVLVLLVYFAFKGTRVEEDDVFYTEFLVMAAIALALFYNLDMTPFNITWVFATYLEILAIMPQYIMIYTTKQMDSNMSLYMLFLFFYKFFYNSALVSLHCDKTIKVNVSVGMVQLMLHFGVGICMVIAFWYRGIDVYEGQIARFRKHRACPHIKICESTDMCWKKSDAMARLRGEPTSDIVQLSCL